MDFTAPSLVTEGIRISVRTRFIPEETSAWGEKYAFAYRISIKNESNRTVQLISRYWDITDALMQHREVAGEGVVGQQPVLGPGQEHVYVSGCVLRTPIGRMRGHYTMVQFLDGQFFEVEIPGFLLSAPYLFN